MLKIVQTAEAREDIVEIASYIAHDGDFEASDRVVQAIGETFDLLAEHPGLGAQHRFAGERLRSFRFYSVRS